MAYTPQYPVSFSITWGYNAPYPPTFDLRGLPAGELSVQGADFLSTGPITAYLLDTISTPLPFDSLEVGTQAMELGSLSFTPSSTDALIINPPVVAQVAQFIGLWDGSGWDSLTHTKYDSPTLGISPRYLAPTSLSQGALGAVDISYKDRSLWFADGLLSSISGPIIFGTDSFIAPLWLSTFDAENPTVIRYLDIWPNSDVPQTKYDVPGIDGGRPLAINPAQMFEVSSPTIGFATRYLAMNAGEVLLTIDPPVVWNTRQGFSFQTVYQVLPETGYGTDSTIVNVNRSVGPAPTDSMTSDGWDHTVRLKDLAIDDMYAEMFGADFPWVSNRTRSIVPGNLDQSKYGVGFVSNSGRAVGVDSSETLETDQAEVILGERFLSTFYYDQTRTDLPIIGSDQHIGLVSSYPFKATEIGDLLVSFIPQVIKDFAPIAEERFPPPSLHTEIRKLEVPTAIYPASEYGSFSISNVDHSLGFYESYRFETGPLTIENLVRELVVGPASPLSFGPISIVKQEDIFLRLPQNVASTEYYWARIDNELRPPLDRTQGIFIPRDERFDIPDAKPPPPLPPKPLTEYADFRVAGAECRFENGTDTFTPGAIRVDGQVISLYEGLNWASYGEFSATHQHRTVSVDSCEDDPLQCGKPWMSPQFAQFEDCGQPLTNAKSDGCGDPDSFQGSYPTIANQNREVSISPYDTTVYGSVGLVQHNSGQYIDVQWKTFTSYSPLIIMPYAQRTLAGGGEQTEPGDVSIANNDSTLVEPSTRSISLVGAMWTQVGTTLVENQHRSVSPVDGSQTIFGDNHPMVHFERTLTPIDIDGTIMYPHWIAHDPQVETMDGSDETETDWDYFSGKMRIDRVQQCLYPLGISATQTGLLKVTR